MFTATAPVRLRIYFTVVLEHSLHQRMKITPSLYSVLSALTLLPMSTTGKGLPLGSVTFVSISCFHCCQMESQVLAAGGFLGLDFTYLCHALEGGGPRYVIDQHCAQGIFVIYTRQRSEILLSCVPQPGDNEGTIACQRQNCEDSAARSSPAMSHS
jgi:hypothetical protein